MGMLQGLCHGTTQRDAGGNVPPFHRNRGRVMSDIPDNPLRTATAADLIAKSYTFAELRQSSEASYRRGVHQSLAFAFGLVEESIDRRDALRRLGRAEKIAGDLRSTR